MANNLTLDMSINTFNDIIWYIELAMKHEDNDIGDIINMVHTIDFLEEEKARSSAKDSAAFKREMELSRIFNDAEKEKDPQVIQMFDEISMVLDRYYVRGIIEELDPEDKFYLIYDIIDKIREVI